MPKKPPITAQPPATSDLRILKVSAKKCLVCDFAKYATQTVFGEGGSKASIMIVGEVPGDVEDLAGKPFVGPSGKFLEKLLDELKIDRREIYVTNAVKHFKFQQRGKRRLHQKPNAGDIRACRPWLESEVRAIQPRVILALGTTAGFSVCSRPVRIQAERGHTLITPWTEAKVLISWHPSAILRSPDPEAREKKRSELKEDLKRAWKEAQKKRKT